MNIRSKLKIIAIVPAGILLVLSSYFFYNSYLQMERAKAFSDALNNNQYIEKSLVELGKERGISALYLATGKKDLLALLNKQRKKTDATVSALKSHLRTSGSTFLGSYLPVEKLDSSLYRKMMTALQKLPETRKAVDARSGSFDDLILKQYSEDMASPLLESLQEPSKFVLSPRLTELSSILGQLYVSQEYTGRTRDYVAYYLEKKSPLDAEKLGRMNRFFSRSTLFDPTLIADRDFRIQAQKIYDTPRAKRLRSDISHTLAQIIQEAPQGNYSIGAIDWFTLATRQILLYQKIEAQFNSQGIQEAEKLLHHNSTVMMISALLVLLALFILFLGYRVASELGHSIHALHDTVKHSIQQFTADKEEYEELNDRLEHLDLETSEGVEEAYAILESLVQHAVDTSSEKKSKNEEKDEAQALFLANMSHEIRTPMNGIIGFTELLKSTPLNDVQKEYTSVIEKSSQNLLRIINNVLDISKVESREVELEHVTFDSHEVFDATIESMGVPAAEKGLDLNCFIDPTISPKLKGDPEKLKKTLTNLIGNAIKFTDRGGEVDVEIQKRGSGKKGSTLLEFAVRDTGLGMSPEQIQKIFQPFSHGDADITRRYGGMGLGLTLAKEYIELMGGELEIESEKGAGSTFRFTVPLEEFPNEGSDFKNAFDNLRLCRVLKAESRLHDYLDRYAQYLGMQFIDVSTPVEIMQNLEEKRCSHALFDYENSPENLRNSIENLERKNLILLCRFNADKELESYGIPSERIVHKPLTYQKLIALLQELAEFDHKEKQKTRTIRFPTRFHGKILVAEDNIINQKLVKKILEGLGMDVEVVPNGEQAVEAREKQKYDLIFMDIQMPVMDGVEATHRILDYEKKENKTHVPIVALTANALKGDRERFLSEGMDEYISKPIEMSELIYILNKFLHDRAEVAPLEEEVEDDLSTTKEKPKTPEEGITKHPLEKEENSSEGAEIVIAKNLPFSRKLLARLLDSLGYDYTVAESPERTEAAVASPLCRILFADESMLSQRLLEELKSRGITLVFTSEPEAKDRLEGISYRVYEGKMTKENFDKFIKDIKGKQ